jgi:hypothetical protein
MTEQSPIGNSFRRAVLTGETRKIVVREKQPKLDSGGDSLGGDMVPRSESRRSNHRDGDRHRLTDETATARHEGKTYTVDLINLSGGGAMIRTDFEPHLWDIVELELGEGPAIECAVRWLRDGLVGLEFAHETKIDCDPEMRARLLLEVIERSFPDLDVEIAVPQQPDKGQAPKSKEEEDLGNRAATRHPMVWSGQILFSFESSPVRIRNISTGGALVDVRMIYPAGSEVMLDLGDAGQFDAVVSWAKGEQAGLKFNKPFDLACLAKLRPDLTPHRWKRPTFLDPADERGEEGSPWDDAWGRSPLTELRSELEGFLKR